MFLRPDSCFRASSRVRSSTTTARLARTAGVELEGYGRELFAAGHDVESFSPEAILARDRKLCDEKVEGTR